MGAALAGMPREKAAPLVAFLESLGHTVVAIIELVMKAAPVGVFCLIFSVTARFGLELLLNLAAYVATVIGSLALFQVLGYSLALALVARVSPRSFFTRARLVMLTAFSTSSSNATLPTTLRVAQEAFGVRQQIAGFVLPLGATMNMNGTASPGRSPTSTTLSAAPSAARTRRPSSTSTSARPSGRSSRCRSRPSASSRRHSPLNVWILSRGLEKGVEIAAKIGMPLLFAFAAVLAVRGLTLTPGTDPGVVQSPLEGLNFVWNPDLSGLTNPSTWLAAAGQIFFTLSVGMGSIHCYASYLRRNQDVALNGASAGWMNEFVEVVLGSSILIPISTAYLGLAAVQAATAGGGGFGLGFMSLPTLFNNWGAFAPIAGAMWFGLLFFAGITSSLAMGQPVLAFLQDEFGVRRERAALGFGLATFLLGGFTVWLYPGGAHGEFDFWTGTFALVVFALGESLVFAWMFGMDRGWEEITRGADMQVPRVFRFVIRWVTPAFILVIFVASLIKPAGEWSAALRSLAGGTGWPLANDSVLGKILHVGHDTNWVDAEGYLTRTFVEDLTRALLTLVFALCCYLVYRAWRLKAQAGRTVRHLPPGPCSWSPGASSSSSPGASSGWSSPSRSAARTSTTLRSRVLARASSRAC